MSAATANEHFRSSEAESANGLTDGAKVTRYASHRLTWHADDPADTPTTDHSRWSPGRLVSASLPNLPPEVCQPGPSWSSRVSDHVTPLGSVDTPHPAHNRCSFGSTTFILSLYNVQARGIATPNVVLGMALGYGGLAQLIAGIEEWACGNVSLQHQRHTICNLNTLLTLSRLNCRPLVPLRSLRMVVSGSPMLLSTFPNSASLVRASSSTLPRVRS